MNLKSIFLVIGISTLTLHSRAQKPNCNQGKIDYLESFPSVNVDWRPIAIWLPNDYDPNKTYNVIYLHDGQNLFDSTITWNKQEWHVDEHLQHLIDTKKIKPCIAVGIWNNGNKRHVEYFPEQPFKLLPKEFQDSLLKSVYRNPDTPMFADEIQSDKYLTFITTELIPYIQSVYSVSKKSKDCIIAGASMGGLISWYAALQYPDLFGNAACFSTHWPGIWPKDDPQQKIFWAFEQYAKEHLTKKTHWYFDHGTEGLDAYYSSYQKQIDAIYFRSKRFKSHIYQGFDHSEKSWSHHFEEAIIHLWK